MNWYRKRKTKFGSVQSGGFHSKLENAVHDILVLREKAGEIAQIEKQVTVYLSPMRFIYKPDFRFRDVKTDVHVYAEAKGFETDTWKRNYRAWKIFGPGKLEVWKGSYRNPKLVEVVTPKPVQHCETCKCNEVKGE